MTAPPGGGATRFTSCSYSAAAFTQLFAVPPTSFFFVSLPLPPTPPSTPAFVFVITTLTLWPCFHHKYFRDLNMRGHICPPGTFGPLTPISIHPPPSHVQMQHMWQLSASSSLTAGGYKVNKNPKQNNKKQKHGKFLKTKQTRVLSRSV